MSFNALVFVCVSITIRLLILFCFITFMSCLFVMPLFVLILLPGSNIYLCYETLYRGVCYKGRFGRAAHDEPPGIATLIH